MRQIAGILASALALSGCAMESGTARGGSASTEYAATIFTTMGVLGDIASVATDQEIDTNPLYQAASSAYRFSSSPDPASGTHRPEGDDCGELGRSFYEDYESDVDGSMCAIYTHQLRVLTAYEQPLVAAGCVEAHQWRTSIEETLAGVRAAC